MTAHHLPIMSTFSISYALQKNNYSRFSEWGTKSGTTSCYIIGMLWFMLKVSGVSVNKKSQGLVNHDTLQPSSTGFYFVLALSKRFF